MQTDRGTENAKLAFIQLFLREDGDKFAKEKSFMYGHSTSNQVNFYGILITVCNYSILFDVNASA